MPVQKSFEFRTWGGKRRGAGRPSTRKGDALPHVAEGEAGAAVRADRVEGDDPRASPEQGDLPPVLQLDQPARARGKVIEQRHASSHGFTGSADPRPGREPGGAHFLELA